MGSHAHFGMGEPDEKPAGVEMWIFYDLFAGHRWKRCHPSRLQRTRYLPFIPCGGPSSEDLLQGVLMSFARWRRAKPWVIRELRSEERREGKRSELGGR